MPKDNANTFSRQMQAFVTIPLKYFSQLAHFSRSSLGYFPVLGGAYSGT